MWKIIAAAAVMTAVFLYVTKRTCTIKCGTSVSREGMTAGLGTINALSMYNNSRRCYGQNEDHSNDPFCTTNGYILT